MSRSSEILNGIYNKFIREEDVEVIAKERSKVCDSCEHVIQKPIRRCGECGCVLSLKTRSIKSECPIGLWSKIGE